jgi:hypothetical protein
MCCGPRRQAGARDTFKNFLNLGRAPRERIVPEPVSLILDKLDKCNKQTPWMRTVYDEAFKQDSGHLLLHSNALRFTKDEKHDARKVVRVTRWKSQLISDCIQAGVPSMIVKLHEFLKYIHLGSS